jgi:excisionase family DNA binding protein
MNLADAIRQAAQNVGQPVAAGTAKIEVIDNSARSAPKSSTESTMEPAFESARLPDPPSAAVSNGGVVRLELFLSPEQLSGLFKAVVANQHTVMTLREAAQYLRIVPSALEQMAAAGKIPAFMIDNKWRFSKSGVDEWLSLQAQKQEMEA